MTHISKPLDQAVVGKEAETGPAARVLGTAKGEFVVPDDFNEPLPDDVLSQFESQPRRR